MISNQQISNMGAEIKQIAINTDIKGCFASWRGASGRNYELLKQRLEDFSLLGDDIYILVANNKACWVGSANDLVTNGVSRSHFRAALKIAKQVYSFKDNSDGLAKMNIVWDIEAGQLSTGAELVKLKLLT